MRKFQFLGVFLSTAILTAAASPSTEIEALLHYIAGLDGASFVRNGSDHTALEAEAHLRLKWTRQKSDIATAEDFIRLCGTQSSLSGKLYLIRFKDGHEEECARVLLRQLAAIRNREKAKTSGAAGPSRAKLAERKPSPRHPGAHLRQAPAGAPGCPGEVLARDRGDCARAAATAAIAVFPPGAT
jgi:hypothetical protein